jgi:hypothetical protein
MFDITSLRKTPRSAELYDLFEVRYRFPNDFFLRDLKIYKVQKGEQMRMDLVSLSIYNNPEYVDFICFINGISNPLNVKEGQLLVYLGEEQIDDFKLKLPSQNVAAIVTQPNRATRPDPSRQEYLDNNLSLPPNLLENPADQVQVRGNVIRLGTD